jgi:hypothetical protein
LIKLLLIAHGLQAEENRGDEADDAKDGVFFVHEPEIKNEGCENELAFDVRTPHAPRHKAARRHGVPPAGMKRMATPNAASRQPTAAPKPVRQQCLLRVFRAARLKPATGIGPQQMLQRRKKKLITPHEDRRKTGRKGRVLEGGRHDVEN